MKAMPKLRLIEASGEMLPPDLASEWAEGRVLRNSYGPTEVTITSLRGQVRVLMRVRLLSHSIAPVVQVFKGGDVPIGKACYGCTAHILDDKLNEVRVRVRVCVSSRMLRARTQVPDGELGELCLGGVLVARGYLNNPEETNKKFIQHPKLGRIYRSGDLCKRDERGMFYCLGRIDTQARVRVVFCCKHGACWCMSGESAWIPYRVGGD
jgi:non-ribosomal peptide synthetase component F